MKRRPDEVLAGRGGTLELLRVPAALYGVVSDLRRGLYDRGWLPSARVEVPVVSVGNLTAGGTGKTPMVLWLANELRARGRRPAVLSRGYGAAKDANGENDEARMFAEALPDVLQEQNPDRVEGAIELIARGAEVIVLDDGFQHRRLARDLDIVLIDATRPWGLPSTESSASVRALLPRGLLRERPAALRRAHALVLTRSDQVEPDELDALEAELFEFAPGIPVLRAAHRPVGLRGPDGTLHPSTLREREVDLVSGLGNPAGFERTVRALGAHVHEHRTFPDHHPFTPRDLDGLGADGRWVVTTAKDAVKLSDATVPLHVLDVEFAFASGAAVLTALLDALPNGHARTRRENLHEGLHG